MSFVPVTALSMLDELSVSLFTLLLVPLKEKSRELNELTLFLDWRGTSRLLEVIRNFCRLQGTPPPGLSRLPLSYLFPLVCLISIGSVRLGEFSWDESGIVDSWNSLSVSFLISSARLILSAKFVPLIKQEPSEALLKFSGISGRNKSCSDPTEEASEPQGEGDSASREWTEEESGMLVPVEHGVMKWEAVSKT